MPSSACSTVQQALSLSTCFLSRSHQSYLTVNSCCSANQKDPGQCVLHEAAFMPKLARLGIAAAKPAIDPNPYMIEDIAELCKAFCTAFCTAFSYGDCFQHCCERPSNCKGKLTACCRLQPVYKSRLLVEKSLRCLLKNKRKDRHDSQQLHVYPKLPGFACL